MKRSLMLVIGVLMSFTGVADIGKCNTGGWTGTAYVDDGWFVYGARQSGDGAAVLNNFTSFLLSPRYDSPIRTVALKVRCSEKIPTRALSIGVFVDGVETAAEKLTVDALSAAGEYEIVKFSWDASRRVDAFRLYLESKGTPAQGEWSIADIYVFYGAVTENEESVIEVPVNRLAVPGNLKVADFSATSLSLAADRTDNAAGYVFSLTPFEESGAFEHVENFASTPEMSADSGWSRDAGQGARFDAYTGSATTDGDMKALKVEAGDVDFISPFCPGPIAGYSFMYRNGTAATEGKSNRIAVYGRMEAGGDWTELLAPFAFVTDTAKHYVDERLDTSLGIRQIRISFMAGDNPSATVSVDSLRVMNAGERIYGETKEMNVDEPACAFTVLAAGRYMYKVKAVSDPADVRHADSEWSASGEIDLGWATLEIAPPQDVTISVSGDEILVGWSAVAGADHYLVDVIAPGSPETYVVEGRRADGTSLSVKAPGAGRYTVKVTACGPYGKAKSETVSLTAEVETPPAADMLSAMPMSSLSGRMYSETFTSLTPVTKATAVDEVVLPFWQMVFGTGPADTVRFSALGGNPSAGGIYVCADADRTADSYGIGSLATGDAACMYGLAMTNDLTVALTGFELSFIARQRTFKSTSKSLVLEYLVSGRAAGVQSEGEWRRLDIPVTAPYTSENRGELQEFAQEVQVSAEGVAVKPGEVLVLRWRDPAMTGSPLTNIDNVKFTGVFEPAPLVLMVK